MRRFLLLASVMPARRRTFVPGLCVHLIHRSHNRMTMFRDAYDFTVFLALLGAAAKRRGVAVHAFALMDTHIHLMATPSESAALSRTLQSVGCSYVRYFNRKYDRIGSLWAGRFRALGIETPDYWLNCLRYVEQNPVRAAMATRPDAYPWTSYRAHADGCWPDWLTPHPMYLALGASPNDRQLAYRAICGQPLSEHELVTLRQGQRAA